MASPPHDRPTSHANTCAHGRSRGTRSEGKDKDIANDEPMTGWQRLQQGAHFLRSVLSFLFIALDLWVLWSMIRRFPGGSARSVNKAAIGRTAEKELNHA